MGDKDGSLEDFQLGKIIKKKRKRVSGKGGGSNDQIL